MLTAEQIAIRATGVGASEAAEVVEMNPYRGPIDCWLRKTGRDKTERETVQSEVGAHLEALVIGLYVKKTGIRVQRQHVTLRHPRHEHVLASPDSLARTEDLGVEAKVVGARMAHHWAEDTIPDYVRLQVAQNMMVTERERWDVAALIGGTDFRVYTVYRDRDLEAVLAEAIEAFWADHVATDVPPPPRDPEERKRYFRARYPGSEATATRRVEDELVASAAERLRELDGRAKAIEAEKLSLEGALCEIVGDDYGIEGSWGKFLWYRRQGSPAWKAIAEELAGGAVPADLIDRHRGEASRIARLYDPKKPLLTGKRRTR